MEGGGGRLDKRIYGNIFCTHFHLIFEEHFKSFCYISLTTLELSLFICIHIYIYLLTNLSSFYISQKDSVRPSSRDSSYILSSPFVYKPILINQFILMNEQSSMTP